MKMKIVNSILRAVVERVTQLEWLSEGYKVRLYVFEHLGQDGTPVEQWIQNWECDDVTSGFTREELKEIYDTLEEYYKCNAHK
jgi:hypothetical protein